LDVKLGDMTKRDITVMFSDIRSFTSLSEKMSPDENFSFLNKYLSYVLPAINNNHGFVDKYMGDGIMALFPANADSAVKAGIAMLHAVINFNEYGQNSKEDPITIGVGLSAGKLLVATVGDSHRIDGTVISEVVNASSDIEALTKFYRCSLLISEETFNRLNDPYEYAIRKVGAINIQASDNMTILYEVFDVDRGSVKSLKLQTRSIFEDALDFFINSDYEKAKEIFQQVAEINPDDRAALMYIGLIEENLSKADE